MKSQVIKKMLDEIGRRMNTGEQRMGRVKTMCER